MAPKRHFEIIWPLAWTRGHWRTSFQQWGHCQYQVAFDFLNPPCSIAIIISYLSFNSVLLCNFKDLLFRTRNLWNSTTALISEIISLNKKDIKFPTRLWKKIRPHCAYVFRAQAQSSLKWHPRWWNCPLGEAGRPSFQSCLRCGHSGLLILGEDL